MFIKRLCINYIHELQQLRKLTLVILEDQRAGSQDDAILSG